MMRRTIYTCYSLLLATVLLPGTTSCTSRCGTVDESRLSYIDTRVGTAPSATHTAGLFGRDTEEYGQTLPAVLEPNGMNFWTAQTRDTEEKCIAPYYYADTLLQGFRNSHWIVGGCTQDYGSMTLMPLFGKLQPEARSPRFSHEKETATPAYYTVSLPDENIYAEMTGRSRSAIFRFTYSKAGKGYLVVNPNSDEGQGYICIDTLNNQIYGYNPVHRIYQGWGKSAGYSGYFIIQFQKKLTDYDYMDEALSVWDKRMTYPRMDAMANNQDKALELFVTGQGAMIFTGNWNIGEMLAKSEGTDFEFDFFLPPIDDEGSAKLCTMVDQSFMVNPNSDCAEEAVEFLEYWVTDGALTWSETTMMPLITGESSDKLLPVVKSMAELKANSSISQGIFTKPFNTEFVNAWRKGLISYAESVCTGKPMTHEECLNNIQSLFDDIIATSK